MSITFQELFKGYSKKFGSSKPSDIVDETGKRKFRHYYRPDVKDDGRESGEPTDVDWDIHLGGKGVGLGIIPLLDDGHNVMWGCIDIDVRPFDHVGLEKHIGDKLPLTITKSKSNGAHCWVFFKEPVPAKLVIAKLKQWAAALGLSAKTEIFPKQHGRAPKLPGDTTENYGNWINLPYYGDTRRCVFEGEEVELEKFLEIAEKRRISMEFLTKKTVVQEDGEFSDGPPCLEMLSGMGLIQGSRNTTLINIGVYLKSVHETGWEEELHKYNRINVDPVLPSNEVAGMIKTLTKNNYNYQCHTPPLEDYCNRALCLTRKHGVARNGSGTDELQVTVDSLVKFTSADPQYKLNIDGVCCDVGGAETLESQQKFKMLVLKKLNKLITPIKADKWQEIIRDLLAKRSDIDVPIEASPQGQFFLLLEEFINQHESDLKDGLVAGNVYIDDGYAYFRSQDLQKFLRREGFREITLQELYPLLHSRGIERGKFNIKGQCVAYWKVQMTHFQSGELEAPTFGKDDFGDGGE
jgi:hypothetical protein